MKPNRGAGGLRAIVTTEEQPMPRENDCDEFRFGSARSGVAEYCVRPEKSGWIIAFEGERFGPYEARNQAMFSAIDAAHNLGEQGRAATVRLIDNAGLPVAVWIHGQDSYPPLLPAEAP
jgi:hypothetical protein